MPINDTTSLFNEVIFIRHEAPSLDSLFGFHGLYFVIQLDYGKRWHDLFFLFIYLFFYLFIYFILFLFFSYAMM